MKAGPKRRLAAQEQPGPRHRAWMGPLLVALALCAAAAAQEATRGPAARHTASAALVGVPPGAERGGVLGEGGRTLRAGAEAGPHASAARVARSALTLLPLGLRGAELGQWPLGADPALELSSSSHPDVGLESLFVPLNASCHPDCTRRGNCNRELGTCECPFGYAGPTCEEALLSACQLGPLEEPFFGVMIPRNCECVRQANKFFGCSKE
ncbi:hypothetical protein TSOC_010542, partial [Tetrabaena socialis]